MRLLFFLKKKLYSGACPLFTHPFSSLFGYDLHPTISYSFSFVNCFHSCNNASVCNKKKDLLSRTTLSKNYCCSWPTSDIFFLLKFWFKGHHWGCYSSCCNVAPCNNAISFSSSPTKAHSRVPPRSSPRCSLNSARNACSSSWTAFI